jgi:hypothetical protein
MGYVGSEPITDPNFLVDKQPNLHLDLNRMRHPVRLWHIYATEHSIGPTHPAIVRTSTIHQIRHSGLSQMCQDPTIILRSSVAVQ